MRAINSPRSRKAFWKKLNEDHSEASVQKALSQLPEPAQGIIRMHYIEGLSFTEITEGRKKSATNTRGYHNRGMVMLVKILYPHIDSPLEILHVRYD